MPPPRTTPKNPIQVIDRMMKLLDVLAAHPEPLGLKQVAQYTGLHPSTAHRILSAMAADRLVDRVEPGSYRLGMRLLELGNLVQVAHQRARDGAAGDARTARADRRDGEPLGAPRRRDRLRRAHLVGPLGDARGARDRRARARCTSPPRASCSCWRKASRELREYAKRTGLAAHTRNTLSSAAAARARARAHPAPGLGHRHRGSRARRALRRRRRCATTPARWSPRSRISSPADRMKPTWGPLVKESAERIAPRHRPPPATRAAHRRRR